MEKRTEKLYKLRWKRGLRSYINGVRFRETSRAQFMYWAESESFQKMLPPGPAKAQGVRTPIIKTRKSNLLFSSLPFPVPLPPNSLLKLLPSTVNSAC